ncbi:hypothetical protein HFO39_34875 [Rhizobium leguminosarum]|uniref:hypothetical protein n=1 Tax=Rhizobium leguminosarum TaxID=384 RepID=UPI001C9711D4|nr:hypothetical protein [Rhizobium leguminosarum]MBY5639862.1 hypothetical protein [Rhizobium leguminosarum]
MNSLILVLMQGAPVHYVGGMILPRRRRSAEIDLRKKFHMQRTELAAKIGLSAPKAKVLRAHLGIDDDDASCCHVFEFGAQKIPCFSDNALR